MRDWLRRPADGLGPVLLGPALLIALLVVGCASLDEPHRQILLRRIRGGYDLAASLETDPVKAKQDEALGAAVASDADVHLK